MKKVYCLYRPDKESKAGKSYWYSLEPLKETKNSYIVELDPYWNFEVSRFVVSKKHNPKYYEILLDDSVEVNSKSVYSNVILARIIKHIADEQLVRAKERVDRFIEKIKDRANEIAGIKIEKDEFHVNNGYVKDLNFTVVNKFGEVTAAESLHFLKERFSDGGLFDNTINQGITEYLNEKLLSLLSKNFEYMLMKVQGIFYIVNVEASQMKLRAANKLKIKNEIFATEIEASVCTDYERFEKYFPNFLDSEKNWYNYFIPTLSYRDYYEDLLKEKERKVSSVMCVAKFTSSQYSSTDWDSYDNVQIREVLRDDGSSYAPEDTILAELFVQKKCYDVKLILPNMLVYAKKEHFFKYYGLDEFGGLKYIKENRTFGISMGSYSLMAAKQLKEELGRDGWKQFLLSQQLRNI